MTAHILIVDDNPTNVKLATDVLEDAGCKVSKAADAEEAQALLASVVPDLVLMDIALPGMDGLTFTRKLKADKRYRRIPIVALTASAMKGDDLKAREAGCRGYITKPIDTRRFAQQVLAFLHAKPSAKAAEVKAADGESAMRILVVEDLAANRRLLRAALEAEGHSALEAANGREALNLLERERVDAIVSDILMPVMDGFRLCLEIRNSDAPYAGLPFILYTATYDSPGDRELAESVGADGYILKPAPMPVLLRALRGARSASGVRKQPSGPTVEEANVLEQYNAALVRKLEERNEQLQRTVAELKATIEKLESLSSSAGTRS